MNEKIRSFSDLIAWKEGHKLVLMVYKYTKNFPKDETFCLISQMRRSAISITSNISEGFSRKNGKEKINFYSIAIGSLTELQNQMLIARDVEYIQKYDFNILAQQSIQVQKLIHGLLKTAASKKDAFIMY